MSKTLLIDYTPFEVSPQMINESEKKNNGRVIVTGCLQRADAKNQNGRTYPKNILMHNVTEVWWKGDDVMGKVEILGTPAGNILKELLKSGIKLGISSRGLGSVEEINENPGTVQVKDDFELICWDFVSNPSTHGAFMKPSTMNESIDKSTIKENKYARVNGLISDILCEMTGKCEIPSHKKNPCGCGDK